MKRTPLYEEHVRLGARMVDFAGWQMPVQYPAGIVQEHLRVRTAAGVFDVSHMGEIEISGPQAEACCARLFANDARRLVPGRAQYSLLCNERGGIVDDVIVYRLAAERFLVCVNASNKDKDFEWMRAHAPSGAILDDRSDEYALIAIQGPTAADIVGSLQPRLREMRRFDVRDFNVAGTDACVARTGYTGADGFELFIPPEAAVALWKRLLDAGATSGLLPAGLGARDTLRLEAALPLYGHELDDDTSPYEVGLDWVVKLNRPEMVGFDALSAAHAGAVARRLVGLEMCEGIARQGCAVLACGAQIGKVTSGSYCAFVEKAVALALVERGVHEAEVDVDIRGKSRRARVVSLPFYAGGAAQSARRVASDVTPS
jgi:aminomethyltransferase